MSNAAPNTSLDRVPWWLWPTVLCLDAPAVAVAWQRLIGREIGVRPAAHHAVLLALAVWLAYVADRWIEGWRLTLLTVRTRRHRFYMRWRWPAFGFWCAGLLAGLGLAGLRFGEREWLVSVSLLAPVLLYLLSHQLLHRHHPARVPKELCVALLIAAGAAIYPATVAPADWAGVLPGAAWLAALGLANCLLISEWEKDVDLSHGQSSLALGPRALGRRTLALPVVLGLVAAGLAAWGPEAGRRSACAAAISGASLALLARWQPRLGRERARVLVDVALLSPVLVWMIA